MAMAAVGTVAAAAPYVAGALEVIKWAVDYAERAQKGELTEEEMKAEWEANVRTDVQNANALWERSKQARGQT